MTSPVHSVLNAIGRTALADLNKISPSGGARRVAEQLGPGKNVVTIIVDLGLRYVSTPLYQS
jgi:hypothetical protein